VKDKKHHERKVKLLLTKIVHGFCKKAYYHVRDQNLKKQCIISLISNYLNYWP
jgi:hypothetical protein